MKMYVNGAVKAERDKNLHEHGEGQVDGEGAEHIRSQISDIKGHQDNRAGHGQGTCDRINKRAFKEVFADHLLFVVQMTRQYII